MRTIALAPVAPALSLVLWSCFSVGRWEQLPASDQDAFQRCAEVMRPTLCGPSGDLVYRTNCMRSNMARYSDEPAGAARSQWLLAHGCPHSMVDPASYSTPSSGGAAPAPAPPPAQPAGVPSRTAVQLVLQEVQRRSGSCLPVGVFSLRLTYGNDGGVILVTAAAEAVPDSVLACVRENARAVPLPPFAQPEFSVVYPFTGM